MTARSLIHAVHMQKGFFVQGRITCWDKTTTSSFPLSSPSTDLHSNLTFSLPSCVASTEAGYLTTAFIVSTVCFRSTEERALPACSLNFPRIPILVAVKVSFQSVLWVNQSQADVTTEQEVVPTSWLFCMRPKVICGLCRKSQTSLISISQVEKKYYKFDNALH